MAAASAADPPEAVAATPGLTPEQEDFYKALGADPDAAYKDRLKAYLRTGFTDVQRGAINSVESPTLRKRLIQRLSILRRAAGAKPVRAGGPFVILTGVQLGWDWLNTDADAVERSLLDENLGPDNLVELEDLGYAGGGDLIYTRFPNQWTVSQWTKTYDSAICGALGTTPCFYYSLAAEAVFGDAPSTEYTFPGWEESQLLYLDTDLCEDDFSPDCDGILGNHGNSNAEEDWAWYLAQARWVSMNAIADAWGGHIVDFTSQVDHEQFEFEYEPLFQPEGDSAKYYALLMTPSEFDEVVTGNTTSITFPDFGGWETGQVSMNDEGEEENINQDDLDRAKGTVLDDCGVGLISWIVGIDRDLPDECLGTVSLPADPSTPPGTEVEPGTVTTTLPKPGLNETYWAYITKLRGLGWLGEHTITPRDEETMSPQAGPDGVVGITIDETMEFQRGEWPLPLPVIGRWDEIEFDVNPPTAPVGVPGAGETVPGEATGGPGTACEPWDTATLNFDPLTGLEMGEKFPFGILGWGEEFLDLFTAAEDAPSWSFPMPELAGNEIPNFDIDLEWLDDYMETFRTIVAWCLWIGAIWFIATSFLGIRGAGDPAGATDEVY